MNVCILVSVAVQFEQYFMFYNDKVLYSLLYGCVNFSNDSNEFFSPELLLL